MKPGPIVAEDLRQSGCSAPNGEKILSVGHVHQGAAAFGVKQPVVRGITNTPGQGGEPMRFGREAVAGDQGSCRWL